MIALDLPLEIEDRLSALARSMGQSTEHLISAAIEAYLEDLEDATIAEQRLADLRAGKTDTVSLEMLTTEYGVAD